MPIPPLPSKNKITCRDWVGPSLILWVGLWTENRNLTQMYTARDCGGDLWTENQNLTRTLLPETVETTGQRIETLHGRYCRDCGGHWIENRNLTGTRLWRPLDRESKSHTDATARDCRGYRTENRNLTGTRLWRRPLVADTPVDLFARLYVYWFPSEPMLVTESLASALQGRLGNQRATNPPPPHMPLHRGPWRAIPTPTCLYREAPGKEE